MMNLQMDFCLAGSEQAVPGGSRRGADQVVQPQAETAGVAAVASPVTRHAAPADYRPEKR